jgi:Raf kinase inhibitor-like YbhB/YbcL family protein
MGPSLILALQLVTSTFQPQSMVPKTMVARDCGGANRSPDLSWSGAPAATKSFALIVHDIDAPRPGGFYHWVLYDLPPSTTSIAAGTTLDDRYRGENSTGHVGYFGPCPPPGKAHRYIFTVYALDIDSVHASGPLTAEDLLGRIQGHVLAEASVTGIYASR